MGSLSMDDCKAFEEGEACFYDNNGGDIRTGTSLSYFDEKIKSVLGHFQKDFEGGVSVENLGARFGGYGSFLLNQQRDDNAARSPNNLPLVGSPQNPKAPSSVRPLASSSSAVSSHKTREASGSTYSCLPSTDVTNKYPSKDEALSSSGNLTRNLSLKVRLKVGSNSTALKNSAIYSCLGLGDSPSSSSENSSDVSEGLLPVVQGPMDGSVNEIIKAMTAFPVPGGALISPLHDNLIWFSRKEKSFGEIKSVLSLEDQEESLPKLVDETSSLQNEGKVVKEKERRPRGRAGDSKNEVYTCFNKERTVRVNGKSVKEASKDEDFRPRELKRRYISNSSRDFSDLKLCCSASDVSNHSKEGMVKHQCKESYLESISHHDCSKSNKQKTKDEKALEQKAENSENYVKFNDYVDPKSKKLRCRPASHEKLSSKIGMTGTSAKNKLEGLQNVGGRAASSFEEDYKIESGAAKGRKDTNSECESKRDKLKVLNNIKVEINGDSFNSTELKCHSKDLTKRALDDMKKIKNLTRSGIEKCKFSKTKERLNGGKVDSKLMAGASDKDGEGASLLLIKKDSVSKVEPAVVAPEVIDTWVQCDRCQKWRLLPFGMQPDHLPEKWLCSMQNWLPGMNQCEISEQETSEKLKALSQLPISNSAHVLQNHANDGTLSDTLVDNCHPGQTLGLKTTSSQGRKKNSSNEIQNPGNNIGQFHVEDTLKKHQQHSRKSRSLNGLSHPPSNQLKDSMGQSVNEIHNFVEGNNRSKLKEKFIDRGNCKKLKRKDEGLEENGLCPIAVKKYKTGSMSSVDNTLKEVKYRRDSADHRLKSSGLGLKSNKANFQSALKFLHEAFLLETGKHGDMTPMQFYAIAAELCETCAHEYERRGEMAAAALAYKCIEVAYMRVLYNHSSSRGDGYEMRLSLRAAIQGESPSSSASDVDNLSNQASMDKTPFNKSGGPLLAGSHLFSAGNGTNLTQLLDLTGDMNLAMEALKKAQKAFTAASEYFREAQNKDCVASVKKVIDFSFHDIEELIRLVKHAMEAITRSGVGSVRD